MEALRQAHELRMDAFTTTNDLDEAKAPEMPKVPETKKAAKKDKKE